MLSEGEPVQLLGAPRTLSPDAVVFTEPASAHGHAISAETLASVYGPGANVARPARTALDQARGLAGAAGDVLVCGSLYLVGEGPSLPGLRVRTRDTRRSSPRSSAAAGT